MLNTCKSNEKQGLAPVESGERVSNAWVMYPVAGDNSGKPGLIPNEFVNSTGFTKKEGQLSPLDRPASHQLVGEVKAHQGNDG